MRFTENAIPYMNEQSKFEVGVPADVDFTVTGISVQWVEFVSKTQKILVHPTKALVLLNEHIQTNRAMTFG